MDTRQSGWRGNGQGGHYSAATGGDGGQFSQLPTSDLIREFFNEGHKVADEARVLLRTELDDAKEEFRAEAKKAAASSVWFGAGGVLLHTGFFVLVLAAVFALWLALPLWASALIVGALVCIAGGVAAMVGKKKLKDFHLKPERTTGHVKEDARWAKDTMRRFQSSAQARA